MMLKSQVRLWSLIWILLVAVLLGACEQSPVEQVAPPPGVLVSEVSTRMVHESSEFLGRTLAVNDVELRARVQGYLIERNFIEGDNISEGDLLFKIESDTYEADVAAALGEVERAEAELARTQDDLKRFEKLYKSQNLSEQDINKARNDVQQAAANLTSSKARLLGTETDLENTRIYSPIDGRIGRSIVSVGMLISTGGEPLARVVELDPMYVSFNVSERDLISLKKKQLELGLKDDELPKTDVHLRLPNGEIYSQAGALDFVDNVVDPTTATVLVRAKFANPDELLIPGMFVRALVGRVEKTEALLIPAQAIQEDQAGKFVMIVDADDMADMRRVKVGRNTDGWTKIIDGLQEGERVVVEGIQKIRPGAKVKTSVFASPTGDGNQ